MTGMTGCGNNKNVASGSNTAMVHNSQPSDNNTKAETQSASEKKSRYGYTGFAGNRYKQHRRSQSI